MPWQPSALIRVTLALHVLAVVALVSYPEQWRWILGTLVLNHLLLALVGLWPRNHWLGQNWTRLPAAAAARNEIALTIDDGPDPVVTPQVLDMLDRYRIKATFFCVGKKAALFPNLCREIVSRGHAVENHSQQHRHNFSFLGMVGYRKEIQAAQDILSAITGQRPQFFRAPAGLRNPFLDPILSKLGLRLVSWSVRGFDTCIGNADQVKHKLLNGLHPGAILLLHDGNAARTHADIPVIIEVLPDLLESAIAAHLRFVTLRDAAL